MNPWKASLMGQCRCLASHILSLVMLCLPFGGRNASHGLQFVNREGHCRTTGAWSFAVSEGGEVFYGHWRLSLCSCHLGGAEASTWSKQTYSCSYFPRSATSCICGIFKRIKIYTVEECCPALENIQQILQSSNAGRRTLVQLHNQLG